MAMENQFNRTEMLIGNLALDKIFNARVAIFGLGGVGSYVVEALARAGVGQLDLIDNDTINITNINRQLFALHSTINQPKVEVAKNRILDINPNIKVNTYQLFFNRDTSANFDFNNFNYVVDAIDSVSSKIELIIQCKNKNTPIISSMGTGNKIHPELFQISDIYNTSVCPLARIIRTELKKKNIKELKVLYSKESPIKTTGERIPASISFVPSVAGLIIASEVIMDIIKK